MRAGPSGLLARARVLAEVVFRGSPRLALLGVLLCALDLAIIPLTAVGVSQIVDAVLAGDTLRACLIAPAIALLWVVQLPLSVRHMRVNVDVGEANHIALQAELVELTQGSARTDHLEAPEFADRLETVREMSASMFWAYVALIRCGMLAIQLVVVAAILGSISPALAGLVVAALAPAVGGYFAERAVARARDAGAEPGRRARHLLDTAADAATAKEIRVFALADELRRRHADAHGAASRPLDRALWHAMLLRGAGQLVFGLAFAAALYVVIDAGIAGTASVGDVVLTVSFAIQLSAQLAWIVDLFNHLHTALDAAGRLLWLRGEVERADAGAGMLPAPDVLREGITLEDVSFTYPAGAEPSLDGMSVHLPAGKVIALVGENGAGKTTLIKLLAGLHRPSGGRILVDGRSLDDIDVKRWRERITAAFQDCARIETLARETIGLGDRARKDDEPAVLAALDRARARDVLSALPDGLGTQLGRSYADGAELSGGQWQKLALSRAMMAHDPLLLLLDEPTAALDPHAEHLLFESYAERARAAGRERGAITLLVSHRFSTVRMADLIVVADQGRIVEAGTHDELMERRGVYAPLFELQASAYR
jgi:ATP-binding cassette subfamily B protein